VTSDSAWSTGGARTKKEHVMKKTVCSFAVLAVFAMVLTGLSPAQDDTYRIAANIPFDFYVGDIQIPAGNYLFNVSYSNHSVTLSNHDTRQTYIFLAEPADGRRISGVAPVLDFDVIADHYLLADVKTADSGVAFRETKPETASAQHRSSVTIVAALR
jgi:hypothetical protein